MDEKTTQDTPIQTPKDPILKPEQVVQAKLPKMPGSGKKIKSFLTIFLVLILVLAATTSALGYAIAYEKINLKKYPEIQKSVMNIVQSIPFMPKTPKFLLYKTAIAHQSVTKQTFEVSAAIDSADIAGALGLSMMDIEAKGALDYSDPKNPNGNLNLSLTKDFNFDLRKKDNMLYFKINKVPSLILPLLGIDREKLEPVIDKWFYYDITPLDTEARKLLEEETDSLTANFLEDAIEKYADDTVMEKMVVTSTEEDGIKVYKISLAADSQLIDHIGNKINQGLPQQPNSYNTLPQNTFKLSEIVKNITLDIYIDKKFYTRKIMIAIDLEFDEARYGTSAPGVAVPSFGGSSSAKIAIAAKFGQFGEDVSIDIPQSAMPLEEFVAKLTETIPASTESSSLVE